MQESDILQIDDDTGDLTIIEMTQDDVGEYSCLASNIAGETVEVSYTTVIGEFKIIRQWLFLQSYPARLVPLDSIRSIVNFPGGFQWQMQ